MPKISIDVIHILSEMDNLVDRVVNEAISKEERRPLPKSSTQRSRERREHLKKAGYKEIRNLWMPLERVEKLWDFAIKNGANPTKDEIEE